MRTSKPRTGLRARLACHRRWSAYGKHLPSHTQGGSRMRESRTYGSVRGACDETHVPTATSGRMISGPSSPSSVLLKFLRDALATPMPRHLAALVEQLEAKDGIDRATRHRAALSTRSG